MIQTLHWTNHSPILRRWAVSCCPNNVGISELTTTQAASRFSTIKTIKSCASGRLCCTVSVVFPQTFSLEVAAISSILPSQLLPCRGRPDAELWSGSAAGCRINTAGLDVGHRWVQRGLAQNIKRKDIIIIKLLFSLTDISVNNGLLWSGFWDHFSPVTTDCDI